MLDIPQENPLKYGFSGIKITSILPIPNMHLRKSILQYVYAQLLYPIKYCQIILYFFCILEKRTEVVSSEIGSVESQHSAEDEDCVPPQPKKRRKRSKRNKMTETCKLKENLMYTVSIRLKLNTCVMCTYVTLGLENTMENV